MSANRNINDAGGCQQDEPPAKRPNVEADETRSSILEDTQQPLNSEDPPTSNNNGHNLIVCFDLLQSSSDSESDDEDLRLLFEVHKAQKEKFRALQIMSESFQKKSRNCIRNYITITMPSYTEEEFRRHFRISRNLYNNLVDSFADNEIYKSLRIDKRYSPNMHLSVFLWFAGHEACSYRDLSDRFDLSLGTVCYMIHRSALFISSLSPNVIKWPDMEKKLRSSAYFRNKCGFSRAIGCIDGTHIVIDPPKNRKDDYIDRKGNVSLCLQGVCDERRKFISMFVGYPGSSHDSWVFQNSPIYNNLPSLCKDYYLLGDSAYPCSFHCVTPYRDNGHLTRAQKDFNFRLSKGRVVIEHTFGILKQRFRQLYYCKIRKLRDLCHFMRACCVLHNIANENDLEFDAEPMPEVSEELTEPEINAARGNAVREAILRESI